MQLNKKRRGIDHCRVALGTVVENRKRNISWSNVVDKFCCSNMVVYPCPLGG